MVPSTQSPNRTLTLTQISIRMNRHQQAQDLSRAAPDQTAAMQRRSPATGLASTGKTAAQRQSDLLDCFDQEGLLAWELTKRIDERPLTSICRPSARGISVAMKGQDTQEIGIWPWTLGPLVTYVDTEVVDTVAEVTRTLFP